MKQVITYTLIGMFVVIMSMSSSSVYACNYGEGSFGGSTYGTGDCGAATLPTLSPNNKIPVYRFYSQDLTTHFFTANEAEKNFLIANYPERTWKLEGVNFYTITDNTSGAIPVYRFWSSRFSRHFYTVNQPERDYIIANYPSEVWSYEGAAMSALPLNDSRQTLTIYRFYNPAIVSHFYTADENEKNRFENELSSSWNFEGPVFGAVQ